MSDLNRKTILHFIFLPANILVARHGNIVQFAFFILQMRRARVRLRGRDVRRGVDRDGRDRRHRVLLHCPDSSLPSRADLRHT